MTDKNRLEEIRAEMRRKAGIKTSKEVSLSVCACSVQIISDTCCRNTDKIIELLTGWAWDEEEAGQIRDLITEKGIE